MKICAFIVALAAFNQVLLRLFPNSDTVWNYALLPIGFIGAVFVVISEMKRDNMPVE